MRFLPRQHIPTLLQVGGAVSAAAGVALLSLFPAARLAGLLLALLAGLLVVFQGEALHSRVEQRARWPRTPLDGLILLLLLQVGLAFWATALPEKTWVAACQLGAGLVAYYAIVNWSRDRDRLWWAVAALILLGLGLALIAPFAVDWFRERKTFLPSALYKFFPLLLSDAIHPNVMAGALATLLPLPLALFLALPARSRRQLWLRRALLAVCLVQGAILILTKSRGGYLALGAGLWLTLWLSGRRRWAIGLTLVAALLAAWLVTRPPLETRDEFDPTQAALDPSTWAFRQQAWDVALHLIGDFPFTGVGLGTFNDVAALLYGFQNEGEANPQAQAVNLYFQVAVDLGLPGLIMYLAILFLLSWMALQAYRTFGRREEGTFQAVAMGAWVGIVAMMVHGLTDTHTWGSKGAFIPWAVMGLVVALYRLALARSRGLVEGQEPAHP
jgi:putative inorganic carbon (HCO3(-)) transporter